MLLGGSILTFVVKGGTVAILAEAESQAGPIERPPLRLAALRRANLTNIEPFLEGCRRLRRRYVKLGVCLLVVYVATAAIYSASSRRIRSCRKLRACCSAGHSRRSLASSALVVWITLINFLYLLTQMAIAVEDLGVRQAMARVARFIRVSLREVAGIFGVVLLLVVVATIASIMATAGLGLIALVPLVGLAMVPLQVAAWLLRGFVFEYLGAHGIRRVPHAVPVLPAQPCRRSRSRTRLRWSRARALRNGLRLALLARGGGHAGVGDPAHGRAPRASRRSRLVCPRVPVP